MSEQEPQLEDQKFREAMNALTTACAAATAAVTVPEDAQKSFDNASKLASVLREQGERAAELRALCAHRIWKQEEVSLAALGTRIGVSKARAGQLIETAKKLASQQPTAEGSDS